MENAKLGRIAQLSATCFGLAWAIVMSVVYTLKVLFLMYFRTQAFKLIQDAWQLEIADILHKRLLITWQSYFSGLLQVFILTYLITFFVALLYNIFISSKYK